jgi:hypothetical protein
MGLNPADTMRLEHLVHLLLTQLGSMGRRRGKFEQVPKPSFIGARAQLEYLGIKTMQRIPQPIHSKKELFE